MTDPVNPPFIQAWLMPDNQVLVKVSVTPLVLGQYGQTIGSIMNQMAALFANQPGYERNAALEALFAGAVQELRRREAYPSPEPANIH